MQQCMFIWHLLIASGVVKAKPDTSSSFNSHAVPMETKKYRVLQRLEIRSWQDLSPRHHSGSIQAGHRTLAQKYRELGHG